MRNFIKIRNLASLIILTSFTSAQNVVPPETQVQIDSLIDTVMQTQNVSALGLSIVFGESVYNKGYGLRDRENGLPTDNNTLFAIGSISKSFTAIVIIKYLSERYPTLGISVLDTPIRILAPSYNFTLGDRYRSEKVTFKDLLAHRVCTLPEYTGMWVNAFEGEDEFYYRQRYSPEQCGLRDGFLYNNGLIGIAGHIIGHLANSTFDTMLSNLLSSIGMSDTTQIKQSDDHNNMMQRAIPYLWKDDQHIRYNSELLKNVIVANAAGGILSNANDMAKYMKFLLNRGKVGDTQIVPEEVMAWLSVSSNPLLSGFLKTSEDPDLVADIWMGYGLCLGVAMYDGWLRVFHDGYLPPFESLMSTFPELGLGIFTTASGPGPLFVMPQWALHNEIFQLLQSNATNKWDMSLEKFAINPPRFDAQKAVNHQHEEEKIAPKISEEEAVGTFGSGFNGGFTISFKNNSIGVPQLYWEYGSWALAWLEQTTPSIFSVTEYDSDFWMMSWPADGGLITLTLEFDDLDTIRIVDQGVETTTPFKRGLLVDDLPEVPWAPDSCSENRLVDYGKNYN